MKKLRKAVKVLERLTDYAMMLFFLVFILAGVYAVYDSFMLYNEAADDSILRFKPGYDGDAPDDGREIGDGMVGWLTVFDTNIDYPVMQGKDNYEFLNKDPFGEQSLSGSIFLDSRNSGDFTDYYSLIYGHHLENALMFGALDSYLKDGYLASHKKGEILTGGVSFPIRLFAVVETDAVNRYVFNPTEYDDETLKYVEDNAGIYNKEDAPKAGERLVALSTCKFPDTADRIVVFGALGAAEMSGGAHAADGGNAARTGAPQPESERGFPEEIRT